MRIATLVFSIFILISISSFSQKNDIDSLMLSIEKSEGTARIDSFNELMSEMICQNDSLATIIFFKVRGLLDDEDYPEGRVTSNKHYGTMMYCQGKLDSTIFYQRKGALIGQRNELPILSGQLYSNLGFLYNIKGNYDSSKFYFEKALAQSIIGGDSALMSMAYTGMGIISQQRGLLNTSLDMYLNGLSIAESQDDTLSLITAKLNLITFYGEYRKDLLSKDEVLELLNLCRMAGEEQQEASALEHMGYMMTYEGNYDSAIAYFNEGLELNVGLKDNTREILFYQGLAYTYSQMGSYNVSMEYIDKAIEIARSSGFMEYLASLYRDGVENLIQLKNYKKAILYSEDGIDFGKQSDKAEFYHSIYKNLAIAYHKLGMNDKAYLAQLEYARLNEEILNTEKTQQLADMQTKYETEKKEVEIASLSQQASIQSLEIKQKNQALVIGLIAFLFVLAAIYFVYKQRETKKIQSQTELEQRFLRSQLNPHFISNALVAVQSFMLKNDSESAALYLTKFSKLMREILENSRKEFIPVEEEISMIKNYLDIHKLRLGSFEYSVDLDENIDPETDTIPPMFVQPFVENAIEHGIGELKEGGKIDLKFRKEGNYISIAVNDNGKGISTNHKQDHNSLSSTIIQERMELFNKSLKRKIELVMANLKNEQGEVRGTTVELKVPFGYV